MRRLLCLLCGLVLAATARAQEDGREVLRQSIEALRRAPAYRVAITDAGGLGSDIHMEVVNPDRLHLRTGDGGRGGLEVYSDGKKTLSREGGTGRFAEASGSVGATIAMARQMATPDALLPMATSVRFAGHDSVNGLPASVYTVEANVLGMRVDARVWVADADRRPLRAEGEVNGEVRLGAHATRRVHRSSVVTYEYDPSIRVVMPTN